MRCSSFISDSATHRRRLPPRKTGPALRGAVLGREWQLLNGDRAAAGPYLEEAAAAAQKPSSNTGRASGTAAAGTIAVKLASRDKAGMTLYQPHSLQIRVPILPDDDVIMHRDPERLCDVDDRPLSSARQPATVSDRHSDDRA